MQFDQYLDFKKFSLFGNLNENISSKIYLTSNKKYEHFFNTNLSIDLIPYGWDVDVYRIQGKFLVCKDNIVYYKEDFNYAPNTQIKNFSHGISQLKFLIDHFNNLDVNLLPDNCLIKVKYIVNNNNYDNVHKIIFIEYYANVKVKVKFSKIKLIESQKITNANITKIFKLDQIKNVFNGILNSEHNLKNGCNDKQLLKLIEQNKNIFKYNDYKIYYDQLMDILYQLKSNYGKYEYQISIKIDNDTIIINNPFFKLNTIKKSSNYNKEIKNIALNLLQDITIKTLKYSLDNFNDDLKMLNLKYMENNELKEINIKDDIYQIGRQLIINKLPGNNNCLILGKFKILTNGHVKLINKALASYDTVTLCLLGNENQYREEMIRAIFKNINIVYNYNASFKDIFDKIDLNISVILTGSDNVKKYREATEQFANISVKEFYKNQNDANGDMVVNRIKNKEYFEKNTPFKIHNFYDRLLNFYAK